MTKRKKLEENIESLDKWSRIWQITKYLYLIWRHKIFTEANTKIWWGQKGKLEVNIESLGKLSRI